MGAKKKMRPNDYDFESVTKLLASVFLSVGIVIYSFCLGFFHRFEIPDYPSFGASIQFYLSSVLKSAYLSPNLVWQIPLCFVLFYASFELYLRWERKRSLEGGIIVTLLAVTGIAFVFFTKALWIFVPLIVAVTSGLKVFSTTLDGKAARGQKTRTVLVHVAVIAVSSLLAFHAIDLAHFRARPVNASFPNGFGVKPYEPSNLLWVEGNKRYWTHCQDSRGVLYGTDNEGKIFIRTEMSAVLYQFFCVSVR